MFCVSENPTASRRTSQLLTSSTLSCRVWSQCRAACRCCWIPCCVPADPSWLSPTRCLVWMDAQRPLMLALWTEWPTSCQGFERAEKCQAPLLLDWWCSEAAYARTLDSGLHHVVYIIPGWSTSCGLHHARVVYIVPGWSTSCQGDLHHARVVCIRVVCIVPGLLKSTAVLRTFVAQEWCIAGASAQTWGQAGCGFEEIIVWFTFALPAQWFLMIVVLRYYAVA